MCLLSQLSGSRAQKRRCDGRAYLAREVSLSRRHVLSAVQSSHDELANIAQ